jgi:glutaminase
MFTDFFQKIEKIYNILKNTGGGKNADFISELSKVNPHLYAISIYTINGEQFNIGDFKHEFAIESCSKIFSLALALKQYGKKTIQNKIGEVSSKLKFDSVCAIENIKIHSTNAFDNGGAMATTSLLYKQNKKQYVKNIVDNMSEYAGKKLHINYKIYKSEISQIDHNLSIAHLLKSYKKFYNDDIAGVVDAYTQQCSVMVTSKDVALMACTLANGGINPKTLAKPIDKENVDYIIDHMCLNGLYDQTDSWMKEVGFPAKSGVSGVLLIVLPGIMGISIISPPLNEYGNSFKGIKTAKKIAKILD